MKILWVTASAILMMLFLIGCAAASTAGANYFSTNTGNDNYSAGGTGLPLTVTQPVDDSVIRTSQLTVSGNTDPLASVTVNGLAVNQEGSHFSGVVELEAGPNLIEVGASDGTGRETYKYLTVVYVP